LQNKIRQQWQESADKAFSLSATDEEVTSLAVLKMEEAGAEPPVRDLQVWFTKGRIYITGEFANILPVKTRIQIVAQAQVQNDQVVVRVEEVSAGSIPLPKTLLSPLSQTINETLAEALINIHITKLEILEGEIIIQGLKY